MRFGLNPVFNRVNEELLELAASQKPDIIWVFKGLHVFPKTLAKLRSDHTLVNYNPDHPFIIAGRGSGNNNVKSSINLYHFHFCYHSVLQNQLEQDYGLTCKYLPFGYQLEDRDYTILENLEEKNAICFIGNPDKIRVSTIEHITSNGYSVDVYGHNWSKTALANNQRVTIHDALYHNEFWKVLRQYRLQLNIFREHNIGSHNMRTFEIPAAGGIQLAPYSKEQEQFFDEKKEVFFYRDQKELIENIDFVLNLSKEQAETIRLNARKRSLESGYSYRKRAEIAFQAFREISEI